MVFAYYRLYCCCCGYDHNDDSSGVYISPMGINVHRKTHTPNNAIAYYIADGSRLNDNEVNAK